MQAQCSLFVHRYVRPPKLGRSHPGHYHDVGVSLTNWRLAPCSRITLMLQHICWGHGCLGMERAWAIRRAHCLGFVKEYFGSWFYNSIWLAFKGH
jgi:hypothetical protein